MSASAPEPHEPEPVRLPNGFNFSQTGYDTLEEYWADREQLILVRYAAMERLKLEYGNRLNIVTGIRRPQSDLYARDQEADIDLLLAPWQSSERWDREIAFRRTLVGVSKQGAIAWARSASVCKVLRF